MDFELPEELAGVQKLARDFAEKEIAPSAARDDREHRFRKDLSMNHTRLGCAAGAVGLPLPGSPIPCAGAPVCARKSFDPHLPGRSTG
jgi:hypothetical protein